MNVLVDTSVWSLALRRRSSSLSSIERAQMAELTELIRDDRVLLIGAVRQELLSGLRSDAEFDRLRERLTGYDDEPLTVADYEEAARCHNRCRAGGVAGSAIDFFICAVAIRRGLKLFTTDNDFRLYAAHLPLSLHDISVAE